MGTQEGCDGAKASGAIEGVPDDYKLPRDSPFSASFKCGQPLRLTLNGPPPSMVTVFFMRVCGSEAFAPSVQSCSAVLRLCTLAALPSAPSQPALVAFRYTRFDALMAPPRDSSKLTGVRRQVGQMPLPAAGTEGDDAVLAAHATVV